MAEIKKVGADVSEQIQALELQGLECLQLLADCPPADVVAAITQRVRDCKAQGSTLAEDEIYALGALLGQQYVKGQGWHWGDVTWDYDQSTAAVGVLNPDNSLFMNPIGWVSEVLEKKGGSVGFMLNYNLVSANQVPVFDPDSATGLY